ncbi:MAG TPA: hypothetical protein P5277_01335 [Candidatus Paceibacterota bacterium]|nr:hypothetical protein [Candidatus Paceibacterota bacterium]
MEDEFDMKCKIEKQNSELMFICKFDSKQRQKSQSVIAESSGSKES